VFPFCACPALSGHVTLAFGEIIKNNYEAVYLGVDDSGLHFSLKDAASMNMAEDGKILINGAMGITGIKKTSTFTMGIILVSSSCTARLPCRQTRRTVQKPSAYSG